MRAWFGRAKPSAEIARVGRLNVCKNPPTPALTKAGAAPGTTGGVEPALSRPWPSRCPRLPPSPVAEPAVWCTQPLLLGRSAVPASRPQQWLLIGVQGCRLTGFKPLKCLAGRLQCFEYSPSAPVVPALQPAVCLHRAQHAPLPHAQRPTSQANGTPPNPFTLARSGFKPAVCHPSSFLTCPQQRVDACAAFAMLVAGSRLPFESLQTPKLSAAALHCVLLGVQECRLPAFKALNPPQQPYTLSC